MNIARGCRRCSLTVTGARAVSDSVDKSPLRRLLVSATSYSERKVQEPTLSWATLPYPSAPSTPIEEGNDPHYASVLLFPGQGSQYVGMGKDLLKFPAAKEVYEFSSSIVGWDVLRVCTEGPEEELTRRAQVCVLTSSLAALERLREERPAALQDARAAAGLSLGELTALVFAAAIPLHRALQLVEVRSAAMLAASRLRAGGLLTAWLAADARLGAALKAACEAGGASGEPQPYCQVSTYLYPGCKVIAGSPEALKFIENSGKSFGIKRSQRLPVSGAFHSDAMLSAVPALQQAVQLCEVQEPRLPVLSNVNARAYRGSDHIRRQLPLQMVRPVRWEQTLHALFARQVGSHFPRTYTIGPGSSVRASLRQVNAKAWDHSMQIDT